MDNELLEKLLSEHTRLVIPGFGAFLRKEGQASSSIVFSPFLKKDDGLLTQIIIAEYGVNNFDAEIMVSEWVAYVKESLASKGKYELDGIGILTTDSNGAIAMVANQAKKPQKPLPSYENHQGQPTIVHSAPVAQVPLEAPKQTVLPIIEPAPRPVAQPVAQPIAQPAPQPVAQPIAQPVAQPIAQPAPQPVAQPIAQPAPQPVAQPIAQPAPQPVAQPIAQPAPQPVAQPIAQPAPQPTVQSVIQQPTQQSLAAPTARIQQPFARPAMPTINTPRPMSPSPRPINQMPQSVKPQGEQSWERPNGLTTTPPLTTPGTGAPAQKPGTPNQRPPLGPDGKPRPQGATQKRPAQQPVKRKPSPISKQKQKVETLLIVAVIAAIIIVSLIIWGLLTVNPTTEFYQQP